MTTGYSTSPDGLDWTWCGTALAGRPGEWDSRGTRITSVCFANGSVVASYDGRSDPRDNYEEFTGLAAGTDPAALSAVGSVPEAMSPHPGHGLRYLDVLDVGGQVRLYYEMTRPDGAHELRTELR